MQRGASDCHEYEYGARNLRRKEGEKYDRYHLRVRATFREKRSARQALQSGGVERLRIPGFERFRRQMQFPTKEGELRDCDVSNTTSLDEGLWSLGGDSCRSLEDAAVNEPMGEEEAAMWLRFRATDQRARATAAATAAAAAAAAAAARRPATPSALAVASHTGQLVHGLLSEELGHSGASSGGSSSSTAPRPRSAPAASSAAAAARRAGAIRRHMLAPTDVNDVQVKQLSTLYDIASGEELPTLLHEAADHGAAFNVAKAVQRLRANKEVVKTVTGVESAAEKIRTQRWLQRLAEGAPGVGGSQPALPPAAPDPASGRGLARQWSSTRQLPKR